MNKKSGIMTSLFAIVIVAFFLPFYEVSCAGQTVGSATGWELASSSVKPPEGMDSTPGGEKPDVDSPWLFVVPSLALAGAVLAVVAARRSAGSRNLLPAAVAAAGAIAVALVVNFLVIRAHVRGEASPPGGDPQMAKLAEGLMKSIVVTPQLGWYLGFLASLAAGVMGALGLKPAAQPAAPQPTPTGDAPPAP